jgi:RNA polymerase primary sigma factor
LAIDDKYDADIQKLIDAGKEKGYLTYNEVNDLLPGDVNSPDDLDDLITTIGTQGIDILEGGPKIGGPERDDFEPEEGEAVDLDLPPATL